MIGNSLSNSNYVQIHLYESYMLYKLYYLQTTVVNCASMHPAVVVE